MKNVLFISLGCDKNTVDSEHMIGLLQNAGYALVQQEEEADAIVINTCCFIHDAREESIEEIIRAGQWKEKGKLKALIVTGCLAQRYRDDIEEAIPEVDAIVGTTGYTGIVDVLDQVLAEKEESLDAVEMVRYLPDIDILPEGEEGRVLTTASYSAYLKIAEGCDKRCSYCVIPQIRGHYRSVPMEKLVREAETLASYGVKELILIAQETTVYGQDLYKEKKLPQLIHRLCQVEGIEWIRLLYCYPEEITDELIETIRTEPKVCHYLDIPIQHSEDKILKAMGRRTSRKDLEELIGKLRREIPDIALRTTLITGFPGETAEEFENMCRFVNEMEFERLGVFPYSKEEGTRAALMEGQISDVLKEERRDQLMELQQEISADNGRKKVGCTLSVLIEGYLYDEDIYVGRTYMDAPKVDGNVFVHAQEELISGDIVNVKITGSNEYDLMGDVVYEFTE